MQTIFKFIAPREIIKQNYQPFIWFLITLGFASWFSLLGIDPHNDGILLKPALDISEGKMLYKETFTQYGAIVSLLQSLFLIIFGKTLLVLKLQIALIYALNCFLLWKICSRFLPIWLCQTTAFVSIALAPYFLDISLIWSSVFALFFQLLSFYLFIKYFEIRNWRYMFFAGFFASCIIWSRLPVGIMSLFSYLIFFLFIQFSSKKLEYKIIYFFLWGYLICNLIFILWIVLNGAFIDFYLQTFKFAYVWGQHFGDGFSVNRILTTISTLDPTAKDGRVSYIWFVLPILTIGVFLKSLISFYNKGNKEDTILLGFTLLSLGSWLQYYPVTCPKHVFWAAFPMFGVAVYSIWNYSFIAYFKPLFRTQITIIIISISLKYDMDLRIRSASAILDTYTESVDFPYVLKGMKVTMNEKKYFESVFNSIDSYNAYIMNKTENALLVTFVKNSKMHGPIYVSWKLTEEQIYPENKKNRDEFIERFHPIIIGWTDSKNYESVNSLPIMVPVFEGYWMEIIRFGSTMTDSIGEVSKMPDGRNDFSILLKSNFKNTVKVSKISITNFESELLGWDTFSESLWGISLKIGGIEIPMSKTSFLNLEIHPNENLEIRTTSDASILGMKKIRLKIHTNRGIFIQYLDVKSL